MKRYILLLLVTIAGLSSVQAQVEKNVEVTKEYIPLIDKATKPTLHATISDTIRINPEIDYSITPLTIETQLTTTKINAATATYWDFNRPELVYVKVGAGAPFNTVLNAHATTQNSSTGYASVRVNHLGRFSKITNDFGSKCNALKTFNEAGVAAGAYLGKHYTLEGDFNYFYNQLNRYAISDEYNSDIKYNGLEGKVRIGDSFSDWSRVNFNAEFNVQRFSDIDSNTNTTISVGGMVGGAIRNSRLLGVVNYTNIGSNYDYSNSTFNGKLTFSNARSKFSYKLGLNYYNDYIQTSDGMNQVATDYIIPVAMIKYNALPALSVFANLDGDLKHNSMANVSAINPYINSGFYVPQNSVERNFTGGIEGLLASDRLKYKVYFGYSTLDNSLYWAMNFASDTRSSADGVVNESYYSAICADEQQMSINLELDAQPIKNMFVSFDIHGYSYREDAITPYVNSNPTFTSNFDINYKVKSVKFGCMVDITNSRKFTEISWINGVESSISEVEIPSFVNLMLYADWKVNNKISIFAQGDNLLNKEVYKWARYKELGINFTAGVKLKF